MEQEVTAETMQKVRGMREMRNEEKENLMQKAWNVRTADEIVKKVLEENKTAPQKTVQLSMAVELGKALRRTIRRLDENPSERSMLMPVLAGLGAKIRRMRQMAS